HPVEILSYLNLKVSEPTAVWEHFSGRIYNLIHVIRLIPGVAPVVLCLWLTIPAVAVHIPYPVIESPGIALVETAECHRSLRRPGYSKVIGIIFYIIG